ncbi:MAG: glycerate kinase [Nitrospirota bacterium]|nr:MAG: glycerate kinase [Nitrospirota bacterium]
MTIDIPNRRMKSILKQLLEAGLQAADPKEAIRKALQRKGRMLQVGTRRYDLSKFNRVMCVGAGKASGSMAQAVEQQLGEWLEGGVVVVKEGYGCRTRTIQIRQAGHPTPDKSSERAGKEILSLVHSLTRDDLLLVILSGGASSLLVAPVQPIKLADKQQTTRLLLKSGASIDEINAVRKHLSAIKGGRLAEASSATIIGLLLSDVIGNEVSTIGSGPTVADPSTYQDARRILESYDLWNQIPHAVQIHLQQGSRGNVPETPKRGSRVFRQTYHRILGDNRLAVEGLVRKAKDIGIPSLILTTSLRGEARDAGKMVGATCREIHGYGRPIPRPACLIWGGELTVTVRGAGKGGRAQEFALSAAQEIAGLPNVFVAGFGTDGTDGPTEAAGAVVDGRTVARARPYRRDPAKILLQNDSYSFFKKVGGHIVTGPTGTNVNDIYLVLAL